MVIFQTCGFGSHCLNRAPSSPHCGLVERNLRESQQGRGRRVLPEKALPETPRGAPAAAGVRLHGAGLGPVSSQAEPARGTEQATVGV